MEWSPTRREFLGVAGAGSLPLASVGTVSWGNATDVMPDSPFASEPEIRWSTDLGDGPAIVNEFVDGTIYVRRDGAAHALSLADGSERWRIRTDAGIPDVVVAREPASPTDEKTVYVTDSDRVSAFEAGTNPLRERLKWEYDGERYSAVLLATPETVVVSDDGLVGLSAADGSERWRFDPPGRVRYPFRTDRVLSDRDAELHVGTSEAGFYALSAADGSVRWETRLTDQSEHPVGTPELMTVGEIRGHVFAWDTNAGTLYAFHAGEGTERWRFEADKSRPVFFGAIRNHGIYLNDGDSLRAISFEDGTETWRFHAGPNLRGFPVATEDGVYVGSERGAFALTPTGSVQWRTPGEFAPFVVNDAALVGYRPDTGIYALDTSDGEVRWGFDLPESPLSVPQFADGTIALATESGTVYAISDPDSSLASDAYRTVTSPAGVAVGGLLGGALAVGAYRRRTRDEPPADPPEPETFEDFELVELVAENEVGEVHEARRPDGGRVSLHRLTTDALSDEQFAEAIRTWAALDHEGALDVREWGTDPAPWVATEYADATLADRAADLTVEEIAHAVADAAEAVHRAHRDGVVHGGLAPGTVLLVGGEVRVANWGLAAALADSSDEETTSADDTARLAETARDLLAREQVAGPSEVLSRALASDPADRYDSALKFADALRWAVRE